MNTQLADDTQLPESARQAVSNSVVVSAGSAIPALTQKDPEVGQLAKDAFSDGTRNSAFAAAGFLVIGLAATLRLGDTPPRPESDGEGEGIGPSEQVRSAKRSKAA